MKSLKLIAVLVLLGSAPACIAKTPRTQVIAHRGYWNFPGSAQNSLRSLERADEIKAYGSECDVWLTGDGQMIVYHDAEVQLDGRKLHIEDTPLEILQQVKLSNGEQLPTFEAYLKKFKSCKNTKLIIELKAWGDEKRQTALAEKTIALVKEMKLQKRVEYIAFSKFICQEIARLDPKAKIAYLNGDLSPRELKAIGCTGLDYYYTIVSKDKPEWLEEARKLGLTVNVWTVDSEQDLRDMIALGVDYITTDYPELLQTLLKEQPPKK